MAKSKRLWVRFPNESEHQEIDIDLDEFERRMELSDEVYGWYKGIYIGIKK